MTSPTIMQNYDLMFITDATGSMGRFLEDLKKALPQIFDLVQLTNIIERVSVLAFRDYCDKNLIEWSGWSNMQNTDSLTSFVSKLSASGGGDAPEAVKTGLWEASKKVERPTICIMYVDAPPHHKYKGMYPGKNYEEEVKALGEDNSQWLTICRIVQEQKMRIYPVFPKLDVSCVPFFVSLAEITDGQCIQISHNSCIVRVTIGILLNLAGVEFEYDGKCSTAKMTENFNMAEILKKDSEFNTETHENLPMKIEAIDDITLKIGNPIKRFKTSEEYKDLVFTAFERLLMPDRVMAFTYNTMFGKLWREICKQRKDPRRDILMAKLSVSVTVVSATDRALLQTFIDETYDQSAEIEEIQISCGNEGPFYVIDHEENLTRKVLFEIGLSCAPFAVQSVLKLLTGLRIAYQLPSKESELTSIPVNLSSALKFKLLPHLICPGTMFGLRLSAIIATIAKISGSILHDDSVKYLNECRGKWIDLTLPECNSMDFARLMLKVAEEALTDEEIKHFRALLMIGNLKKSKNRQIDVEVAYSSHKSKRADFKNQCKTCKQWRSTTLLLDETCALCLCGTGDTSLEARTEGSSWMCECRMCLVHYAVYHVDDLKCRAKCHFCRIGEIAPYVKCQMCNNKFLYQQSKPSLHFICAVCTENKGRVGEKCHSTIAQYIAQNGAEFFGMKISGINFLDDGIKVFKLSAAEKLEAVRHFAEITEGDLADHKLSVGELSKEVWNVKELQQQVLHILTNIKVSQCMICFEDFPAEKLSFICGSIKKGCTVGACRKCLNSWYNQLAPGRVCQPAQLVCPYCKRVPILKIVRQYNRRLCTLMNVTDVGAFNPSYIHAWCTKCYGIKQAMPRECGGEHQEIIDFKCVDCSIPSNAEYKECPKCKVITEKNGGCNHIACENILKDGNKCDAHWCWVCGVLSTNNEIYKHLSEVHGGFFSPEDVEVEEPMYEV